MDQEQKIAFQTPALYSNRFVVTLNDMLVKLTFLEGVPESDPVGRFAALMTHPDAAALRDLLDKMLKETEQ